MLQDTFKYSGFDRNWKEVWLSVWKDNLAHKFGEFEAAKA